MIPPKSPQARNAEPRKAQSLRPGASDAPPLSSRQASVLRAMVMAYVGSAAPVGSTTVSHVLPVSLSPASIRNTLAELTELGLVAKPHRSAGRIPTECGLRHFVDALLTPSDLAAYEQRTIAYSLEDTLVDSVARVASQLLSEHTRQLGFMVAPRIDRLALRHVSLVRLSTDHLLVLLISQSGVTHRRVIEDDSNDDQAALDRIATMLNERIVGLTLREARAGLAREANALRHSADRWVERVLELGALACAPDAEKSSG